MSLKVHEVKVKTITAEYSSQFRNQIITLIISNSINLIYQRPALGFSYQPYFRLEKGELKLTINSCGFINSKELTSIIQELKGEGKIKVILGLFKKTAKETSKVFIRSKVVEETDKYFITEKRRAYERDLYELRKVEERDGEIKKASYGSYLIYKGNNLCQSDEASINKFIEVGNYYLEIMNYVNENILKSNSK